MKKENDLGRDEIGALVWRTALPSMLAQFVSVLYSIVDRMYIGHIAGAGETALAGVGVCGPVVTMVGSAAVWISWGASPLMGIRMGEGRPEEAKRILRTGFVMLLAFSLAMMALVIPLREPMLRFFGASDATYPYADAYFTTYLMGTVFALLATGLNQMIIAQGFAAQAMRLVVLGAALNIALDPVFIFALNMGTAGAALATALSQVVSFCILLTMCNTKADALSIRFSHFKPSLRIYGGICYNGIPSLGRQGIASISTILLNNAAGIYGDAAIAAMSIVSRYTMFINSSVIGFGQGFQPVCGFSYGAGKYKRVRESFWFCVKVVTIILIVLCLISLLLSGQIIAVFRRDDPQVIEIGTLALRLQLLTLPLWGYITMCNMFTQSIGYGVRSTIISTARQGIFLIPALLILPRVWGLLGIQIAQPVADLCTLVLCWLIVGGILRQLKAKETAAG